MTKKVWYLVENNRPRRYDCVRLYKEHGYYSINRCIDDWDEDGDGSPYNVEEYLNLIPDTDLQQVIGATTDNEVVRWVKKHMIKEQSNSLDAVEEFLKDRKIHFSYGSEHIC